jgi:maltose alpha-D-glucosyltransferase / alpha-amylase
MPTSTSSEDLFLAALKIGLPRILPQFLLMQRWFGGKARTIRAVEVSDIVPFHSGELRAYLVLAQVEYGSGPGQLYHIPLVRVADGPSHPGVSSLLRVQSENLPEEVVLKDALTDEQFLVGLLDAIAEGVSLAGARGLVRAVSTPALQPIWRRSQGSLTPFLMKAEQSNSSVVYEKRLVLKIYRHVEEGLNPDLEIGSFLTGKTAFRNVPPLAGYLEYRNKESRSENGTSATLGMLQGYISNQGDAWQFTLKALAEYYSKARQSGNLPSPSGAPRESLLSLCGRAIPDEATQRIGAYLESAALLGRRTAELHLALASAPEDPDFSPQPFSEADRKVFVNSAVQLLAANFELLRRLQDGMPDQARREATNVLQLEEVARRRFQLLAGMKSSAMVTRIHGDYHLGQVLFTGSDFVIIDFEGEPARPLEERRKKRSPMQDVAGMLRSFHYAVYAPLLQQENQESPPDDGLGSWAQFWQRWVSATFLKTYLEVARDAIFIPQEREELSLLLDGYLLDKAVYELGYELNNRPTWVRIPLDGISQLLQSAIGT